MGESGKIDGKSQCQGSGLIRKGEGSFFGVDIMRNVESGPIRSG